MTEVYTIESMLLENISTRTSYKLLEIGRMNCDRFINSSSEKIDFEVLVPKSKNIFVKLVFTDYKTVMTGDEKNGKFMFKNIPENEKVKIIAIDE